MSACSRRCSAREERRPWIPLSEGFDDLPVRGSISPVCVSRWMTFGFDVSGGMSSRLVFADSREYLLANVVGDTRVAVPHIGP